MAKETLIAWTDHTYNPWWGCVKVGPGCTSCYANSLAKRYGHNVWGPAATTDRRTFGAKHWAEPIKWNAAAEREGLRRRVFCASMCDVFEDHPAVGPERDKLWPLIRATPWLDWQILTKRPERIAACLPPDWGAGYPNVWLGTSIENADYASRADHLRAVPAVVRFVSYEPALGPLADALDLTGIDWTIFGGESGPHFRPMDVQWARDMRDACAAAGVAYFFKQSAGRLPGRGEELDGAVVREYPTPGRSTAVAHLAYNHEEHPPQINHLTKGHNGGAETERRHPQEDRATQAALI